MKKTSAAAMIVLLVTGLGVGTAGAALIVNGGFETGDATGFSSAYTYNHVDYYAPGIYDVNTDPRLHHNSWASYPAHSGRYMMIVNGANEAGVGVWGSPAIAIAPNTVYDLSVWVASSYPESPAVLSWYINGNQVGSTFVASTTTGLWQLFQVTWNSGSSTTATLGLINENIAYSGNDFTLDDIALAGNPVPVPGTLGLLGSGLAGLVLVGARRRNRR